MDDNVLEKSGLDKNVPIPLYFQLKELILREIKNGVYEVGNTIPTELELSEHFEISRTTVRQAITELVQDGWLYRVKSKGTFVARPKINQSFVQAIGSFNEQMIQAGRTPSTEVLKFEVVDATEEIAEALQLSLGDKAIYIYRRRFADGIPIVIVRTYLSYEKCKFILDHDLENESLYSVLSRSNQTNVHKIKRQIEALIPNKEDIQYLDLTQKHAIQQFKSVGYNVFDEPIEYSTARYRGDQNTFEVTITAG
ncbi:GntR family transcriptional regulator [Oceanobacillus jeddahense]|uniref:GntR family transcriptional regulator n=1 Tax=Oceanobacillus jeddahense TaxID=1462527 RepID=A0ABY5JPV1_9BACI|nr:GntR family transcriptional regulator [Oceanobacillus jeddahense]UUI02327.1 GntR family transcriptional regulator [Oceanobacillus jeddahense]